MTITTAPNKKVFPFFLTALFFAPLAFGSVEIWSLTVLELLCLAPCAYLAFRASKGNGVFYIPPGIFPMLCFLALHLLQLLPLPQTALRILSPATYDIYAQTLWKAYPDAWGPLSVHTKAGMVEFLMTASGISFYVLTVQVLSSKRNLQRLLPALSYFTAALAFEAVMQHLINNSRIFWFRQPPEGGIPFGPFVNRNHYAGFMGMLFPVILGLFLYYKPSIGIGSWKERLIDGLTRKGSAHILTGFICLMAGVSIFLSLSRGGIISLCISMLFFGAVLIRKLRMGTTGWTVILTFTALLYLVGWFGWESIFKRFESFRNQRGEITEVRKDIWRDTTRIIRDFPLLGAGFGTFGDVYRKYRSTPGSLVIDHAHNDYLELVSEGGVVGLGIFIWLTGSVLRKSWTSVMKRHDPFAAYVYAGAATGAMSLLVHAMTDFNLHIGSNALYFYFMLGLAVAAANTRLASSGPESNLDRADAGLLTPAARVLTAATIFAVVINAGILTGKAETASVNRILKAGFVTVEDARLIRDASSKASYADPLESGYEYLLGGVSTALSDKSAALEHYRKSVRLDPLNSRNLQGFAASLSRSGSGTEGEALMKSAIRMEPVNPELYREYAFWLIGSGRKSEGLAMLNKAASLDPGKTTQYISAMVLNGFTDEEIGSAVPDTAESVMAYARYLSGTGKIERAAEAYQKAFHMNSSPDSRRVGWYLEIFTFFSTYGMNEKALSIISEAADALPSDAGLRLKSAEEYAKNGLAIRAEEEYRKVLMIDPENVRAKERLSAMRAR